LKEKDGDYGESAETDDEIDDNKTEVEEVSRQTVSLPTMSLASAGVRAQKVEGNVCALMSSNHEEQPEAKK